MYNPYREVSSDLTENPINVEKYTPPPRPGGALSIQLLESSALLSSPNRILNIHNSQPPHPFKKYKQPLRLSFLLFIRHLSQLPLRSLRLIQILSRHRVDIRPTSLITQVRRQGDVMSY